MPLKPVTFINNTSLRHRQNIFQQNVLLKSMAQTTDLSELKKIAQFHSEAEVMRSMDKMVIRKEFHKALAKHGMGPDGIVGTLVSVLQNADKDPVKVEILKALMKSLGLDKYDASEAGSQNWEEVLLQIHDREQQGTTLLSDGTRVYDVIVPEMPEEEIKKREEEKKMSDSIYE